MGFEKERFGRMIKYLVSFLAITALASCGGSGRSYSNLGSSSSDQGSGSVIGNAGTSYQRIGNTTFGSDGTSYQQIGNSTFGSDGTSYQRIGNTTFGSDGTTCTAIGASTFCN